MERVTLFCNIQTVRTLEIEGVATIILSRFRFSLYTFCTTVRIINMAKRTEPTVSTGSFRAEVTRFAYQKQRLGNMRRSDRVSSCRTGILSLHPRDKSPLWKLGDR